MHIIELFKNMIQLVDQNLKKGEELKTYVQGPVF